MIVRCNYGKYYATGKFNDNGDFQIDFFDDILQIHTGRNLVINDLTRFDTWDTFETIVNSALFDFIRA